MRFNQKKRLIFGVIFLVAIIITTTVFAPTNNKNQWGSTYGRNPHGYGAWYQYMIEQQVPIQRWQKPFSDLETYEKIKTPITFVQINSVLAQPSLLPANLIDWTTKGNILVILGIKEPVTKAPFRSLLDSSLGQVQVGTTRRYKSNRYKRQEIKKILADDFGAIVWEEKMGKGKVIYSTSQYLGANAYQNVAENFKFLNDLLTQDDFPIVVDEYLHGYKDKDIVEKENRGTILSYFRQTPVFAILIQIIIIFIIAIISTFKRFGQGMILNKPIVENSQAYLNALAEVLQKAESSDFVIEMISKEEQKKVQQALGLGDTSLLERKKVISTWKERTEESEVLLNQLLLQANSKKHFSNSALLNWLLKWQEIHQILDRKKQQ